MEFTVKIGIIGINPYVAVPPQVSRAMAERGHVPVKGSINGFHVKATLVPAGGGHHRLYINGEMRKAARVGVGDEIKVFVEPDPAPRVTPMPEAFRLALETNKKAKAAYKKLPPSHQKEYLDYLNWLKTPEALDRNIQKVIASLVKTKNNYGI